MSDRPPTREELAVALATNAASKPFNIAVAVIALVVALAVAVLVGAPAFVALPVAVVLYTAAVARTMFDADEAERVERKHRGAGEPDPPA